MKKFRLMALLLAMIMVIVCFSGCKGGEDGNSSTGSSSDDEMVENLIDGTGSGSGSGDSQSGVPTLEKNEYDAKAKLPKFDIKPNSKGKKVVSVCIDWSPDVAWMQDSIKAFQKMYPDVTIEWKQATPTLKATKLAIWQNAGTSPDVMYIKPEENWPTLMNENLVQPIDSYININDAFWGSCKETMNSLKLNNKNYFIPTSITTYGSVIYNPTVFKNAGLKTPEQLLYEGNWTWEKFEEYAKKLTKKNSTDEAKSVYGVHLRYPQAWHGTVGMDYIGYENGKWVSNLNNSKLKKAIEKYKELNDKYGGSGDDATATRQMLISGKIGMYVTCESGAIEFPEQFKDGSLIAVCMPRYSKDEPYYNSSVTNGYVIPKGAKNPEAGMAFATVCRALTIGCIDYKADKSNSSYTEHQIKLNEYCDSTITGVVMHFRRLERNFNWFSVVNPYITNTKTYAAIVAEMEPQFLEELNKQ